MALGQAFDPQIKESGAALRAGVTQFKVDFTRFREWYNAERWFRENSLIGVSAGADGVSGFRRDGAWAALRDEITRFSQIMFSGRPGEREFYDSLWQRRRFRQFLHFGQYQLKMARKWRGLAGCTSRGAGMPCYPQTFGITGNHASKFWIGNTFASFFFFIKILRFSIQECC